ncbi:MAG: hypothetical protein A2X49_11725 [Lentisphaerae bacterium GWF2_52_8]|nr:MAG: hypothetical protein A2X49_11725 [Lentisphaerae bacterium GWF2_52_8]
MKKTGVQSFDRGLEILKLLAENKKMTASAIAEKIGFHQTSATRMLQSLQKAKFVYKPDFHSFALDIGVLVLGSISMESFPLISRAAEACNQIKNKTGLDAAVATLVDERLLYFSKTDKTASFKLIDDSSYPVHLSSLGLILSHAQGKRAALRIINQSIKKQSSNQFTADKLYELVEESVTRHGFLYMKDFAGNKINCSMAFNYERGEAALSVFSKEKYLLPEECRFLLLENIKKLANAHN